MDYDSADSAVSELSEEEEEDNVFEGDSIRDKPPAPHKENTEHSNPASYSWCVMRLAIVKMLQCQLQDFLNMAGIELQGSFFYLFYSCNVEYDVDCDRKLQTTVACTMIVCSYCCIMRLTYKEAAW